MCRCPMFTGVKVVIKEIIERAESKRRSKDAMPASKSGGEANFVPC